VRCVCVWVWGVVCGVGWWWGVVCGGGGAGGAGAERVRVGGVQPGAGSREPRAAGSACVVRVYAAFQRLQVQVQVQVQARQTPMQRRIQ
jgi:hypothetical protein